MELGTGTVAFLMGFFGFRSRCIADKFRDGAECRNLIEAQPDPTPIRLKIDASPARYLPDLPPREMAKLHAKHLLEWMLDPNEFDPDSVIDTCEMYLTYEVLCQRNGWAKRPWNPVAAELNRLLGGKPYRRRLGRDGVEIPVRVYVVPGSKHRLRKPKKPKGIGTRSKSRRLRADARSASVRIGRVA